MASFVIRGMRKRSTTEGHYNNKNLDDSRKPTQGWGCRHGSWPDAIDLAAKAPEIGAPVAPVFYCLPPSALPIASIRASLPRVPPSVTTRSIALKARLAYLLIRLLGLLPLPLNHLLGGTIGLLASFVPSKMRRDTRVNLALCFPELSERERRRMLRRIFIETGKTATEAAYAWTRSPEQLDRVVVEIRGADLLYDELAKGRGLILAAPHLGAWELLGLYWAARLPMHNMYRPPRKREFEPLLTRVRERSGAELVPATAAGVRRLYRALAQGHVVGILPDQEPSAGQGVFAPFFGRPALTMTLLSKLAHRADTPVVFGFAERLPWGRGYRIHMLPAPAGIADPDPIKAATALNAGVERCARMALLQYQWTYRRFRRHPVEGNPYSGQPL